ncbi:MAG: alpha/beta hydrolase [Polyangiaceae bacterium]|nr:alpha/beta hydrolase [Polyangiaceae bacterium]
MKIQDGVDSVISDIQEAGLTNIVLVGNSMAGLTMPGVAAGLADSIAHLVFSSCTVPADDQQALCVLRPDIQKILRSIEALVTSGQLRLPVTDDPNEGLTPAAELIGDDAGAALRNFTEDPIRRQSPDTRSVLYEHFSFAGFPPDTPRTYIKNLQDRMVPPALQDEIIVNLGGARVVERDTPHCPALSHPNELATVLNGIMAELQGSDR